MEAGLGNEDTVERKEMGENVDGNVSSFLHDPLNDIRLDLGFHLGGGS